MLSFACLRSVKLRPRAPSSELRAPSLPSFEPRAEFRAPRHPSSEPRASSPELSFACLRSVKLRPRALRPVAAPCHEGVKPRLVGVDLLGLLRRGAQIGHPSHKLAVRLLALRIHMFASSLRRVGVAKACCDFSAFEPGHLVRNHNADLKQVLVCTEYLDYRTPSSEPSPELRAKHEFHVLLVSQTLAPSSEPNPSSTRFGLSNFGPELRAKPRAPSQARVSRVFGLSSFGPEPRAKPRAKPRAPSQAPSSKPRKRSGGAPGSPARRHPGAFRPCAGTGPRAHPAPRHGGTPARRRVFSVCQTSDAPSLEPEPRAPSQAPSPEPSPELRAKPRAPSQAPSQAPSLEPSPEPRAKPRAEFRVFSVSQTLAPSSGPSPKLRAKPQAKPRAKPQAPSQAPSSEPSPELRAKPRAPNQATSSEPSPSFTCFRSLKLPSQAPSQARAPSQSPSSEPRHELRAKPRAPSRVTRVFGLSSFGPELRAKPTSAEPDSPKGGGGGGAPRGSPMGDGERSMR